jgi:hypothetical protein
MPCSADSCDSANETCVNDESPCSLIQVTPDCSLVEFADRFDVPIYLDQADGEDEIGFTLRFDEAAFIYNDYSIQAGALGDRQGSFDCLLNQVKGNEVDCFGTAAPPLAAASDTLLAVLSFDPAPTKMLFMADEEMPVYQVRQIQNQTDGLYEAVFSEPPAPVQLQVLSLRDDRKAPADAFDFLVTNLLGDLQSMDAGTCFVEEPTGGDDDDTVDEDDDMDSGDDDSGDDDSSEGDESPPSGSGSNKDKDDDSDSICG